MHVICHYAIGDVPHVECYMLHGMLYCLWHVIRDMSHIIDHTPYTKYNIYIYVIYQCHIPHIIFHIQYALYLIYHISYMIYHD